MKNLVYAAVILLISLVVIVSCDSVGSSDGFDGNHDEGTHDEEGVYDGGAAEIVKDFIRFMKDVYDTYGFDSCDVNDPAFVEIYNSVESYYYIDDSANDYPNEGKDGVKRDVSTVLCQSLPVISQATDVTCGLTKDAENIPDELEDDPITAVATVSLYDPNAGEYITRSVVKIGEKWYIRAVYYHVEDYNIYFYPEREEIFF